MVAGEYENDNDRETMNRALTEMGASGKILYRKGGNVKLVERTARTGPRGCAHNEFETTRVQRMSIAFLGAAQTITIDANTGSQESSDNMADVAASVVADHWESILADLRRDLIQVYVELNYGLENADLTPILGVDLGEPADANATLDAFTKGDAIGLQVGENFARKKLRWPAPGPGEKPLGKGTPDVAPAEGVGGGPRSVPAPADGTKTNKEAAA
jgi:phage gp29-like protein